MKKKKNHEFNHGLFVGICSVIILIGLIYLGYLYFSENPIFLKSIAIPEEMKNVINKCSNESLADSAECAQNITQTFYKYNWSNFDKDIDFETLTRDGGVCNHWTEYWCYIGKEIGFYIEEVHIDAEILNFTHNGKYDEYKIGHTFCIWSDESGYVIADGKTVHYFKFEID